MKKIKLFLVLGIIALMISCGDLDTGKKQTKQVAGSGVQKATVEVKTNANGLTTEQVNIGSRLNEDSKAGAIKHFYVISPYSGQILIYSTVKGKITSSMKRLNPRTVSAIDGQYVSSGHSGIPIKLGGNTYYTGEVLEDDGSYGDSVPYIYWWDVQGRYHQHFFTGGQIIHLSDQPITTKSVIINMETLK